MATNYSSSALVERFHNLPHYDLRFRPVSNDFDVDNPAYRESLMQFAAPWVVVAIISILALVLCGKGKTNSEYAPIDDSESNPVKKWKNYLLFACVIVVIMSPIQYYANEEITIGVGRFSDRLSGTQKQYDNLIDRASDTSTALNNLQVDVNQTDLSDDQKQDINNDLESAITEVTKVLDYSQAFDIEQYTDDISRYDKLRWQAMLGFAALLLVAAALAYIGRKGSQKSMCWIDTIIATLGLIVTGIYFALAVAASDFCSDPNTVIGDLLPTEGIVADAARYYVNCPPESTSPFLGDLEETQNYINSTYTYISELNRQVELQDVLDGLVKVNASTVTLAEASECDGVHQEYIGALQAVCGPTLEGFMIVLTTVAISAMCIVLASCSLKKLKRHMDENESPLYKPGYSGGTPDRPRRGRRGKGREYDPLVSETYFGR